MKSKVKYKLNSPLTRYRWEKWGLEYNTRHFWKKHYKVDLADYMWQKNNAVYDGTKWTYNVYAAGAPNYAHYTKDTTTYPDGWTLKDGTRLGVGQTVKQWMVDNDFSPLKGSHCHLVDLDAYPGKTIASNHIYTCSEKRLTANVASGTSFVDVDIEHHFVLAVSLEELSFMHDSWIDSNLPVSAYYIDGYEVEELEHEPNSLCNHAIIGPGWKGDPSDRGKFIYQGMYWCHPEEEERSEYAEPSHYDKYGNMVYRGTVCYDKNTGAQKSTDMALANNSKYYEGTWPYLYGVQAYDATTGEYHKNTTGSMHTGTTTYQGTGQQTLWGAKDRRPDENTCNFYWQWVKGRTIIAVQHHNTYYPEGSVWRERECFPVNGNYSAYDFYAITPNSYMDGTHLYHVIPLTVVETDLSMSNSGQITGGGFGVYKEFKTTEQDTSTTFSSKRYEYWVYGRYHTQRTEDEHDEGFSGDEYWEWVNGPTEYWHKGDVDFGYVGSTDRNAYPDNGHVGDFWYTYIEEHHDIEPGAYIRQIWSANRNAYPDDGPVSDDDPYYYIFDETKEDHNPTVRMEDVITFDPLAFPNEDTYLGYYYYLAETISNDEFEITSQFLQNGITYKHSMNNSSQDLQYGAVVSASLEFTIMPQGRELLPYINKADCEAFISMESDEGAWRSLGLFKTNKIVQNSNHSLKITCYDPLYEASQLTVAESSFPSSVTGFSDILVAAIGAMGLDLDPSTIPDDLADLWSPTVAKTDYPTFRDLLAAWAEVMLCSILIDRRGKVICKRYDTRGKMHTVHWERDNYATYMPTIDGLQEIRAVRIIDEDGTTEMATAGTFVKSSKQDYIIQNNKFAESRPSQGTAQTMLNILAELAYYAGSLTAYDDFDIHLGDICTVNQWDLFLVMSLTIAPNGVTISSTGNRTYES